MSAAPTAAAAARLLVLAALFALTLATVCAAHAGPPHAHPTSPPPMETPDGDGDGDDDDDDNDDDGPYFAPDPCTLRPRPGPCFAAFRRFYYDPVTKKCTKFIWGGCGGVVPFLTRGHCLRAICNPCLQEPVVGRCRARIRKFFFNKSTNSCDIFFWGGCGGNVPFDTLRGCRRANCN